MRSFSIKGIRIGNPCPVLMGVLNLSPESFYKGSYVPPGSIRDRAISMISDGAEILDIGARSTAPGSIPISVKEEIQRVKEALYHLQDLDYTISIDTMHPEVLTEALRYDINIINDISGLLNLKMREIIADAGIPAILMASSHSPGDSRSYKDTISAIKIVLERADKADIKDIILDPGIGKWIPERTSEHDWEICRRFDELKEFERPLLAAVSRKSFIGQTISRSTDERLAGTLAVTTGLILKGASVIRTHDVRETKDIISATMKFRDNI